MSECVIRGETLHNLLIKTHATGEVKFNDIPYLCVQTLMIRCLNNL